MIGQTLGHYRILEKIGQGGMGEVYRARDLVLERDVALKILPEDTAGDPKRRSRFEREAKAVAALSHPNILAIHGFETVDGTSFAVTELLDGETLRARMDAGDLPARKVVDYAVQIATGLAAAHDKGIVHRDLKPENVIVTRDERVKILDFGLALVAGGSTEREIDGASTEFLTSPGVILGTIQYMAPEQVRGEQADSRTDIFAFGTLLYELLTGEHPFLRPSPAETMSAILREDPPADSPRWKEVPGPLRGVVLRCLGKNPRERFQAATDLAYSLGAASDSGVTRRDRTPAASSAPDARSIAVLPFANMSTDPESEYLGDGLTEEILNSLVQIPGLNVAARSSAFAFKGKSPDIREVGAKLGVSTVLEGSVRRSGRRVRVTAQLINVSDGYHLWSTRIDRDADDLLAIQEEIANAIAGKLRATLGGAPEECEPRTLTRNPEAYDLYLRGRFHVEQRGSGIQRGLELLQRSLEQDPSFAAAHVAAAEAYLTRGFYGQTSPREDMPRAKAAARKGLALDPDQAFAHAVLAFVTLLYDWDWTAAAAGFRKAMELDPGNAKIRSWYGLYLLICAEGRIEDGVAACREAAGMDPLDTFPAGILGASLYTARRYEEALPLLRDAVAHNPDSYAGWRLLGLTQLALEDHAAATTALQRAVDLSDRSPWPVAELGIVHAASGRSADTQALYDELRVRAEGDWVSPVSQALLSMALGRLDQAFVHLEQAYRDRDPLLIGFLTWPLLDPLRADPRFRKLLDRIGFEPLPEPLPRREAAPRAVDSPTERKMVVVLPFENLGPTEEDYFADGITEEITSRLAEVSDLGVISRTSAVQYERRGKTMREIGQDLGAGYVLEGTVRWDRRTGNRVRITPQLIRVSDDTHMWTERYDRVLDDIFAVQSEIAAEVISHLEASLLETGRKTLDEQPTRNLEAYQAYLRALGYTSEASITEADIRLAIKLFERAVELDPDFADAWSRLSLDHGSLYVFGYDMSDERARQARDTAERARELAPDTYLTHLALGYYAYRCEKNYDEALRELGKAAERRPRDARLLASISYIQRRKGDWEESIQSLESSLELDPKNAVRIGQLGISMTWMRRYERAEELFSRSISLLPDQEDSYLERVLNLCTWDGLVDRAEQVLRAVPGQGSPRVVLARCTLDMYRRDWQALLDRLAAVNDEVLTDQEGFYPRQLLEYRALKRLGDERSAEARAEAARAVLDRAAAANPEDPRIWSSLGRLHAEQGRKKEALEAGDKALGLAPVEKDVVTGVVALIEHTRILAEVGETEAALDRLDHLLATPARISPAILRIDPSWDPLRGEPRFQDLTR